MFMRRRISLGAGSKKVDRSDFLADVELSKLIRNDHVAPIYASYTARGAGYVLTPFVGSHTLRTFIEHRTAPQYTALPKRERQELLLRWMHCLACSVADLHRDKFYHSAITPSNILIDSENRISFADIGSFKSFQKDKKIDDSEMYDYAPPEAYPHAVPVIQSSAGLSKATIGGSSRIKSFTSSSSGKSSAGSMIGSSSGYRGAYTPANDYHMDNDVHIPHDFEKPPPSPSIVISEPSSESSFNSIRGTRERSDIFSLGCIFIDILTFLLKKKLSDAVKHRQSKIKLHGRGSSSIDTSYHVNIDKAFSWCDKLEAIAFDHEDSIFRGLPPLVCLIKEMLHRDPEIRPTADEVKIELVKILRELCKITQFHCSTACAPSVVQRENMNPVVILGAPSFPQRSRSHYRRTSLLSGSAVSSSVSSGSASIAPAASMVGMEGTTSPIMPSSPARLNAAQLKKERKEYYKKEKGERKREKDMQIRAREKVIFETGESWQRPSMAWVG